MEISRKVNDVISAARPLVSVIVPAHNYGHLISQTLNSVLAQSYPHLECIVVDDGSTDDTRAAVMPYAERDARIRYLYQKNQGVSAARTNGMKKSAGAYIQFLDADDLLERRKLELHVEYLEAHPEVDIVYGSARFFRTERIDERLFSMFDEQATSSRLPQLSADDPHPLRTLIGNMILVNTALSRRGTIEFNLPFDDALGSVEDSDFWIRCAAQGARFQYYDPEDTLALVRSHPISLSKSRRNQIAKTIMMRRKIARTITEAEALRINRKMWAETEGYLGIEEVKGGNVRAGVGHLLRAARMSRMGREQTKWAACALAAPFVRSERFARLPTTPISQWWRIMLIGA